MDQFKVGDKVWCLMFGEGQVVTINDTNPFYPVGVVSDSGFHTYSRSGKLLEKGARSLFFNEPTVYASTTRPFVSQLLGKYVMVGTKEAGMRVGKVFNETTDEIRVGAITWEKSRLNGIYEVTTENVLKP